MWRASSIAIPESSLAARFSIVRRASQSWPFASCARAREREGAIERGAAAVGGCRRVSERAQRRDGRHRAGWHVDEIRRRRVR
jgi:hypothetical protein